jgi:UDP-N-acetyl-D-mannosaminuronate dehydrogenase
MHKSIVDLAVASHLIGNLFPTSDIGMIGLGVMGRNLLLNMAEKGFSVAGYDRDHR